MTPLAPFILLVAGGILCLLLKVIDSPKETLFYFVFVLLLLFAFQLSLPFVSTSLLHLLKKEKVFLALLAGASLLWHIGTWHRVRELNALHEFYALLFLALSGMALFIQSQDFLLSFLALEIFSLALYILCGFGSESFSMEAALKYFFVGSLSSTFFLLGLAFVFGATGTTHLVSNNTTSLYQAGLLLILGVFFFKFSLFPFFVWVPDVYQGAPYPVTSFMATTVKITLFPVILTLVSPLLSALPFIPSLLAFAALFTQLCGNLIALAQKEVKRMLSYSSIAHAGYLSLAFLSGDLYTFGAFYLLSYTLMTFGSFLFFQEVPQREKEFLLIEKLNGRGRSFPFLWALPTLFLLSLIGIPITAGFSGKILLFGSALKANYFWLVLLALINSVISAGYYLKIPFAAFFEEGSAEIEQDNISFLPLLSLILCAIGVLFLGLLPSFVLRLLAI